ncbi:hypothetical protein F4780DRAFT_290653 [Xylariomycetidae sp. FL0641]|nr:hypothetical protein F4780DRAFT_290653 [Xylariomycetidae sp. FL0641]
MKSLKMRKVLSNLGRKKTDYTPQPTVDTNGDGPEAIAARSVKLFCEAGGVSGDEVLHLPPIVDAAESSPSAAAECAHLIRKYLKRDYWTKPPYQYNAIMLIRILADNPGQTFTRNLDQKFTDTAKELLRSVREQSVRNMMMETLESFEKTKSYDEGLHLLIDMWKKEKEKAHKATGGQDQSPPVPPRMMNVPQFNPHSQDYFQRPHHSRRLPDPVELASRLEEAKTSANLLQQVVTNTPPGEVLDNDLIKEFSDRCASASRSIQGYMQAEDPAPDNDTMESLIDTNEHLQQALSLHQRALLNARKHVAAMNDDVSPLEEPQGFDGLGIRRASPSSSSDSPVSGRRTNGKGKEREYEPPAVAGPSRTQTPAAESDDPFRDPEPAQSGSSSRYLNGNSGAGSGSAAKYQDQEPRLAFEPFHPGFDSTPSYLGRQESALGKETMHGAAPRRDEDDDSDSYEAPSNSNSKQKQPVYRY